MLAIDIGNTNVKLGTFDGDQLTATWRLETDARAHARRVRRAAGLAARAARLDFADIDGVSLSSTVPAMVPDLQRAGRSNYLPPGLPAHRGQRHAATPASPSPSTTRRRWAPTASSTRWPPPSCTACPRSSSISAPPPPSTRSTAKAVCWARRWRPACAPPWTACSSARRGCRASSSSSRREVIGRNTVAALRSGWVYGYVGLVEGLVTRIKAELGDDALVIATGGLADYVLAETSIVDVHDPTLTLKGLRLYYERNVACPSP